MERRITYLRIAAGFGAAAVIIGAFGAHGLEKRLTQDLLETYETGVRYHFYHTLALLAVAATASLWNSPWTLWACRMWIAGIVIFSGSLYALAITDTPQLGAITPFGGLAMILGWIFIGVAAGKSSS